MTARNNSSTSLHPSDGKPKRVTSVSCLEHETGFIWNKTAPPRANGSMRRNRLLPRFEIKVIRSAGLPIYPPAARLPQKEIFQDELPVACRKRLTANTACYFTVDGFRPSFDFDDLIKRVTVWALEIDRRRPRPRLCPIDQRLSVLDACANVNPTSGK